MNFNKLADNIQIYALRQYTIYTIALMLFLLYLLIC